ncbi:hypothetical protein QFZ63_001491 [Streptomyces sp. B3I7]|uniref:hypothetical protein n=1 Tax=Streptomyces sp. B3I7 TaxID=3042269 RepID=UPI0027821CC7|nr:hypothetical protein [Streptomyces sp. B3I7]MDQ0809777.1 hypothetical protein [Streptomyces sp. B3I7]
MSTNDFPTSLLDLERSAWQAIRTGQLTTDQAAAAQDAITTYAAERGYDRHEVEMGLKRAVRHGETANN